MITVKPIGRRPHCLHCDRELRPQFIRVRMPLSVPTGEIIKVRTPQSYGKAPEYEDTPQYRPATVEERKQFKKDHPPQLVAYGDYRDNRFCNLRCGYNWAVAHSKEVCK